MVKELPVIYLQTAACSGCAVTLLNTASPTIKNVLIDQVVPGVHINLRFHPVIMAAAGELAIQAMEDTAKQKKGEYVLAMEVASYASLRYPMSDLPKEVFDTGYLTVTPVYGHRLCFFVPDDAGACRLDVERTAQPRGLCLYDGDEQAALRLYWTATQRRIVPVEFQPPADQRGRVWAVNLGQKTKRTSFALNRPLLPYISLRREQFFVPSPAK